MCLDENTLIRLAAGELPPTEYERCMAHLEVCAICRKRHAQLQGTWDLLGEWRVPIPEEDLSSRILAAAQRNRGLPRWVAVAAAILLAAGAGIATGLLVPHESASDLARQELSLEEVVQAIGLDTLAGETVALTPLFTADQTDREDLEEPQL